MPLCVGILASVHKKQFSVNLRIRQQKNVSMQIHNFSQDNDCSSVQCNLVIMSQARALRAPFWRCMRPQPRGIATPRTSRVAEPVFWPRWCWAALPLRGASPDGTVRRGRAGGLGALCIKIHSFGERTVWYVSAAISSRAPSL